MNDKQRLKIMFVAALLLIVTSDALNRLIYTSGLNRLVGDLFDARIGYYAAFIVAPALIMIIAAIPGSFMLRYQKFPHYLSVSLAAALQAFAFVLAFMPVIAWLNGWWLVDASRILFTVLAYVISDTVFNKWNARFRYKVMTIAAVIAITILLDRIFAALY